MRLYTLALLASTVAVGACDKGPSVDLKNASPADVAKAMKDSGATRAMVRPGKWASTVSIAEMDTSTLPPELAAKINAEIGKPRTVEACLTPEEVDHPERMLAQVPATCRYEYYKMSGGNIDGKLRCTGPAGNQEMTVQGTYGKDRYSMLIGNKSSASVGSPVLAGPSSKMKVESHRIGDCDGKPAS
ncbi:MAG: DUF3617 domain-containing protein [Sphingomicrobium sp.]